MIVIIGNKQGFRSKRFSLSGPCAYSGFDCSCDATLEKRVRRISRQCMQQRNVRIPGMHPTLIDHKRGCSAYPPGGLEQPPCLVPCSCALSCALLASAPCTEPKTFSATMHHNAKREPAKKLELAKTRTNDRIQRQV